MSIEVGSKAPDLTLSTITADGPALVSLSKEWADSHVVLLFFPMAFTGVCTEEFCSLSQGLDSYGALNAKVYGVSGDNPFAQQAWAEKEKITVPLLSDYEHTAAKDYGIAYESFLPDLNLPMGGVAQRSAFVVAKGGEIVYAETSADPKQLPDFDAIKAKLGSL